MYPTAVKLCHISCWKGICVILAVLSTPRSTADLSSSEQTKVGSSALLSELFFPWDEAYRRSILFITMQIFGSRVIENRMVILWMAIYTCPYLSFLISCFPSMTSTPSSMFTLSSSGAKCDTSIVIEKLSSLSIIWKRLLLYSPPLTQRLPQKTLCIIVLCNIDRAVLKWLRGLNGCSQYKILGHHVYYCDNNAIIVACISRGPYFDDLANQFILKSFWSFFGYKSFS